VGAKPVQGVTDPAKKEGGCVKIKQYQDFSFRRSRPPTRSLPNTEIVPRKKGRMNPFDELKSLEEAFAILCRVAGQAASGPPTAWRKVNNARGYVQIRMDEIATPILAEETEEPARTGDDGKHAPPAVVLESWPARPWVTSL
jgi:hypothetical protein